MPFNKKRQKQIFETKKLCELLPCHSQSASDGRESWLCPSPPPPKKNPKSKPAIFYWICSSKTCLNVYFHLSTKKVTPCEFSSLVNSLTLRENIFLLQWSMVWGKKYISLQLSQVERSFRGTLKRRDVPSLVLLLLLVLPVTFCLDKVKLKN